LSKAETAIVMAIDVTNSNEPQAPFNSGDDNPDES
jgi:hypothetical protein